MANFLCHGTPSFWHHHDTFDDSCVGFRVTLASERKCGFSHMVGMGKIDSGNSDDMVPCITDTVEMRFC